MSPFENLHRRDFMRLGVGTFGLTLPGFLVLRRAAGACGNVAPRAKSCIVLYCWGGMSHHETWDPKPEAPAEYCGEFQPIATAVPGIRVGEHMPRLARHADKLAIIRSMHHRSSAHGKGMYWNFTGHAPMSPEVAVNMPPTRQDWPSLGAMVSRFRRAPAGFPSAVQMPYSMIDNETLQAGENAGFLGLAYDPAVIRPDRGRPWGGMSRDLGAMVLHRTEGVDLPRLVARQDLARTLDRRFPARDGTAAYDQCRQQASALLLNPAVQAAFNLDFEPLPIPEDFRSARDRSHVVE